MIQKEKVQVIKTKNDQQVIINRVAYNKRKGVLQIVRMLANDYDNDLNIVGGLLTGTQGMYEVVLPLDEVRKKGYMVKYKRFFIDPEDIIVDKDYKLWAVCNQWGIDNVEKLIERVNRLKYNVKLR